MGQEGYKELLRERKECYKYLREKLKVIGEKWGERVLEIRQNPISIGKKKNR